MFWPFIAYPLYDRLGLRPNQPNCFRLLNDGRDDACADGAAAFTNGEAQLFFHGDRHDQRALPSKCCRPASPFPCLPAGDTTPVTSVVRK